MRMRQRTRILSLRRHIAPRRSRRAPADAWGAPPWRADPRARAPTRRRDSRPEIRRRRRRPQRQLPVRGACTPAGRAPAAIALGAALIRFSCVSPGYTGLTLGSTSPCARPRIVCTAKEDAIVGAAAHGGHGSELNRYTAAAVYSSTGISGRRGGLEAEVLPALPVEHVRARHLLRVVLGELGRFTLRDSVRFSEMLVDSPCAITDIMMGTLHQVMGAGR